MADFSTVLAQLDLDRPRENITSIKRAVTEQIQSTDKRVSCRWTDYFNHGFAPDLVLMWPEDKAERFVFLRTSYDAVGLHLDVETLADSKPMIVSLEPISDRIDDSAPSEILQNEAARAQILVTDPSGLDALEEEAKSAPVVTLLSHALLQGGRGIVGGERAIRVAASVDRGFSGAGEADEESTRDAVEQTRLVLDSQRAANMSKLLHAVWVGSGAPASTFPGPSEIGSSIDVASLKFLLTLPPVDDDEFWLRISKSLTLERLCELYELEGGQNLETLVSVTVDQLRAKAFRVLSSSAAYTNWLWSISGGCLTLTAGGHQVAFTSGRVVDLPDVVDVADAVSIAELRTRTARRNTQIEEVQLATQRRQISYGSEQLDDVSQDRALEALHETLGEDAFVRSVTCRVDSERTIRCDFVTRIGAGRTVAKYHVREMVEKALPVFVDLTEWI